MSAVGLCVRCSAGVSVAVMLLYLFQGLTPALLTLATGAFIDAAIGLLRSGEYADVGRALTAVSLLVSFDWISNQLLDLLVGRLRIDVRERFGTEMVEKVADLRYRYVENPESWDLITKISTDTDESILNAFQALLAFLALVWKALGLFLVMFRYVPAAALAVTACAVPLVMLSLAGGRASYAGISETQGLKRRYEYISRLLTGRDAAEERTLFGWAGYFNGEWESAYKKWLGVNARVNLKSFAKAKLGSISLVLIAIVVMTALLPGVVAGEITIGIFMALVSNIFSLVQLMSWSLLHSVSEIAKYNEFFHDVETFTKMDFREAESVSCELPEFSSLEFRDVTFAYPGTKRKVLDHLSFQISAGKSYSFVGANGCGKTTITKLIAGLYDDYEGQILINGTDIREWGPGRIAGFFSIVYQDFASDPMVLITPNTEKYQAFAGKPFPIKQLKEETFISREKGSGTYQAGKELLNELGIDIAQLRTAVEIRSTESVKQMVSEGLGVGLIAQSAAQDYVQFGKLLAFPFPDSRFRRQLYIVKHKNSILSPIAQVFYDYARKTKDKASAK